VKFESPKSQKTPLAEEKRERGRGIKKEKAKKYQESTSENPFGKTWQIKKENGWVPVGE